MHRKSEFRRKQALKQQAVSEQEDDLKLPITILLECFKEATTSELEYALSCYTCYFFHIQLHLCRHNCECTCYVIEFHVYMKKSDDLKLPIRHPT